MTEPVVIPWGDVAPLDQLNGDLAALLANVDTYRAAWDEFIATVSEAEFDEARRRSLRRHAVETGIIERLYDVSWGVTEALVAEGLTLAVAAAGGGIAESDLETIRAQYDALEFLSDVAREPRELSVSFIKRLHELITQHQATYEARDAFGRVVHIPLHHGRWKESGENYTWQRDGTKLEYTPYQQVQPQMERLVDLFTETREYHPLVRAAWLHHRFIRIHPFEDGNGRVARALVLLVLLQAHYAPIVVPHDRREEYLDALETANAGDLRPLIRLFARLEIVALLSELKPPQPVMGVGESPAGVARAYAERLRRAQIGTDTARAAAVARVASDIQRRLETQLSRLHEELTSAFRDVDPSAFGTIKQAAPPDDEARWWYVQIVRAAQAADFFANVAEGSWWTRLRLSVRQYELRFVAVVQKVGHGETGIIAVTTFAEFVPPRVGEDELRPQPVPLFEPTSADHVTLNHNDTVDAMWPEICELIERTLSVAVDAYGRHLGG